MARAALGNSSAVAELTILDFLRDGAAVDVAKDAATAASWSTRGRFFLILAEVKDEAVVACCAVFDFLLCVLVSF